MARLEIVREEDARRQAFEEMVKRVADDPEIRVRVATMVLDEMPEGRQRETLERAREAALGVLARRSTGPAWRRLGMGWRLGLGEVEGVVLVEVHDSETVRGFFTPCAAVVEVWGGDEETVRAMVEARKPFGVIVLVLWRRSTWWLRMKLRAAYAWRRIARGR